jgi:hypothetical protein
MFPADIHGVRRLSSSPVIAPILGGRSVQGALKIDFEDGPIDLNDPSSGLFYQIWEGRVYEDGVFLFSDLVERQDILNQLNITEFSFTFDQNGRPAIVYVQYGIAKVWWYDSAIPGLTTTTIGGGVISPKLILDDKRQTQTGSSDIILGYIQNENLYYRQQRDRFGTAYLIAQDVIGRIQKLGMGNNLRLHFILGNY